MNYLSEISGASALKTIFDIKDQLSKGAETISKITGSNKRSNTYLGGSISQYTKDLIMTFPMLCDDTLSIDTASMISRANERYIISLLQMIFASENLQGDSGLDVIRQIHRNIRSNMSLDDYIDLADEIDKNVKTNFSEASEINRARRIFTESLKYQSDKRYPISSFSENSLNDYACINYGGRTLVSEAKGRKNKNYRNNNINSRSNKKNPYETEFDTTSNFMKSKNAAYNDLTKNKDDISRDTYLRTFQAYDQMKLDNMNQNANRKMQDDQFKANLKQRQKEFYRNRKNKEKELDLKQKEYELKKAGQDADLNMRQTKLDLDIIANQRQQTQSDIEFLQKQLVDSDVKKANELAPSLMMVKFVVPNSTDPKTLMLAEKPFICGVKSRLIPTEARDIVDRLISKNKTKISFLNLIRATTGEIGFVKDFLFSLDQAKIDSKNAVKRGPAARIWKTLEFRSTKNQKNMLKKAGNDASAITTLVINQETANFMKKEYEFNIEDLKNTRLIMDSYNLLGIIICDEALEIVKAYYAGNDSYETQAFSYLEKESNDKSYKKVISLINQMNGR